MIALKRFEVSNLFGVFDHTLNFNIEENVTIITAPNGFGKTAVLRLINAFYSGHFMMFKDTEFSVIKFSFSDGASVIIQKAAFEKSDLPLEPAALEQKEKRLELHIRLTLLDGTLSEGAINLHGMPSEAALSRFLPHIRRVGIKVWQDRRTGERLSFDELQTLYERRVGPRRPGLREPDWLRDFRSSLNCRFIETQRLLRLKPSFTSSAIDIEDDSDYARPVVSDLAIELRGNIQTKLAEYGATAQSLESSYPRRLISKILTKLPEAELRKRLTNLDKTRKRLMEAGLLDKEEALQIQSKGISTDIIDALSIYVSDTEKKLDVFDDLFSKIEIFQRILGKRLQFKLLQVNGSSGFSIVRFDGVTLPLAGLSSGEQHEIVLVYELLFRVEENSLILIDEPELSLHVAWQSEFLSDISEIIALRKFQVIIATHSPQVINERWDLAVELQEPYAAEKL